MSPMCFAFHCNHRSNTKKCRFFTFPRDKATFNIWVAASRRSDSEPKYHSRLCSCHFVNGDRSNLPTIFSEDYLKFSRKKRRKLIPAPKVDYLTEPLPCGGSTEGPNSPVDSKEGIDLMEESKKGIILEGSNEGSVLLEDSKERLDLFDESNDCNDFLVDFDENQESIDPLREAPNSTAVVTSDESQEALDKPVIAESWSLQPSNKPRPSNDQALLEDQLAEAQRRIENLESELALQVAKYKKESPGNVLTYASLKNNFNIFHYYTGLPNFSAFDLLMKWLSSTEINYHEKWQARKIELENQLLLTLIKLRLNPDYTDLGVRFQICVATARNIFLTLLETLHTILFPLVKLPSSSEIPVALTLAFRKYSDCRCIVDTTEVQCDRSRKAPENKKDFPRLNGKNTLKVLIACTPSGALAYVGKLFPDSATDEELFTEGGFIQNFVGGDTVLTNKKFSVSRILPPGVSLRTSSQFKDKEPAMGKRTRARIPTDTVLCRIKNHRILDHIPHHMKPYATKIFQLVACLVDLHPPLGQTEVEIDGNGGTDLDADMTVG